MFLAPQMIMMEQINVINSLCTDILTQFKKDLKLQKDVKAEKVQKTSMSIKSISSRGIEIKEKSGELSNSKPEILSSTTSKENISTNKNSLYPSENTLSKYRYFSLLKIYSQ